ncbi:hypothetical protein B0H14DRAFT_3133231 [Mycena olivaceomarginata]|nr:hypothetical protein B0H14DRAFT_3133231 [Mycena olivaceomarginata]
MPFPIGILLAALAKKRALDTLAHSHENWESSSPRLIFWESSLLPESCSLSLPTTIIPNLNTADAADVVHQIMWGRKSPKYQRSGPKLPMHMAAIAQRKRLYNSVCLSRHRTAVNVPGATIQFRRLPRKITIAMLACTSAASPFSHAPQRVWQCTPYWRESLPQQHYFVTWKGKNVSAFLRV